MEFTESQGETFNDVLFTPQYSDIESRSQIHIETDMGKFSIALPLISANMKDITGPKMAYTMAINGRLGILHRFGTIDDAVNDYKETINLLEENGGFNNDLLKELGTLDVHNNNIIRNKQMVVGVSIGVQDDDKERLKCLYSAGARLIVIDVAHGHHVLMKNMLQYIRGEYGDELCLIAGNVATSEGARALMSWGADIVKVGIGPGSACETRKNTGAGVPQLRAIRNVRKGNPNAIIISDGGIKHNGDIPKALKYANAVMVGSFIAGTSETPGHVYQNDKGEFYKVYGGSASGERKVENGRKNAFVEGVVKIVPFRGKVKFILRKSKDCIQSSFSYSGSRNLPDFMEDAILEDIGSGGKQESKI